MKKNQNTTKKFDFLIFGRLVPKGPMPYSCWTQGVVPPALIPSR